MSPLCTGTIRVFAYESIHSGVQQVGNAAQHLIQFYESPERGEFNTRRNNVPGFCYNGSVRKCTNTSEYFDTLPITRKSAQNTQRAVAVRACTRPHRNPRFPHPVCYLIIKSFDKQCLAWKYLWTGQHMLQDNKRIKKEKRATNKMY